MRRKHSYFDDDLFTDWDDFSGYDVDLDALAESLDFDVDSLAGTLDFDLDGLNDFD